MKLNLDSKKDKNYYRKPYRYVVQKIQIDPVKEGAVLETRIKKLMDMDLTEMSIESVIDQKTQTALIWINQYYLRAYTFWTIYAKYVYYMGQLNSAFSLRGYTVDYIAYKKQIEKKINDLWGANEQNMDKK